MITKDPELSTDTIPGKSPLQAGPAVATPPAAAKHPRRLSRHGHTRIDDYYWLRDDTRADPRVLDHLETENRYVEAVMAPVATLRQILFEEIISRIKPDDVSVPLRIGEYWYYTRYRQAQEYPVHARRHGAENGAEEIILDVNELAAGHEYFQVGKLAISDNHRLLAYAEDPVGRRRYTLRVKDLTSDRHLGEVIPDTSGAMAWAADNETLFYVRIHPETLLPYQVYRHRLGTAPEADTLVYEEPDPTFYTSVYRGKSRQYIYLHLASTVSDEVRLLPAGEPDRGFQVFLPRERGHEYSVADIDGRFYVRSNFDARNFRILETPLSGAADRAAWKEFVPHREDTLINDFELFKDYLVVSERHQGLCRLRALPLNGGEAIRIASQEPAYAMSIDDNDDPGSNVLRYGYCSMTTPYTIYDQDLSTGRRTLRKQAAVLGEFDSADYATERITAVARDGVEVPISLVYRRGYRRNATHPLLVYAYGAYGLSTDPTFSSSRLSLLDRGFVFAVVHVRGGQEMGRRWYDDGKLRHKMNTFNDFIDATTELIDKEYADPRRVYAIGGSAGGLLVGAVVNMAPRLFHGAIALVPFVDVITTMLDESIPLTTGEFDEWGNPADPRQYEYLLSYSPYDQVRAQDYPHMLVTTGLHDSQVQYWEPAKWVAKLRELKTDDNRVLLHTDMGAGHGGASGRFKCHRDTAMEYAFLLMLAGIDHPGGSLPEPAE